MKMNDSIQESENTGIYCSRKKCWNKSGQDYFMWIFFSSFINANITIPIVVEKR